MFAWKIVKFGGNFAGVQSFGSRLSTNLRFNNVVRGFDTKALLSTRLFQTFEPENMDNEKLFISIGLKPNLVKNFIKNEANAAILRQCIKEANVENGCDGSVGNLIYDVATNKSMNNERYKDNVEKNRPLLLKYIVKGDINTPVQLRAAIDYCVKEESFDNGVFERTCGVGVVVTKEEIDKQVNGVIDKYFNKISQEGKGCFGKLMHELRQEIPFADGKLLNTIFNEKFKEALEKSGNTQDNNKKNNVKSKGKTKGKGKNENSEKKEEKKNSSEKEEEEEEGVVSMEKWLKGRDLPSAHNTKSQLADREKALNDLKLKKNIFLSRFPPEPNGFLHIGHCKAMTFNFELAKEHGGECYLRFDDTNPEAEEQLYIDNIIENVKWMGFNPWKITFSSEYFQQLYDLAVKMIKDGNAYVCHQTKDAIENERKSFREKNPKPSPWRDTSVDENLRKFELMRLGYYAEGEASLRMKGDIHSSNPNMWDHIAYRIKYVAHPHVGDKWCVYPTYDYTHCIVDSIEWITASCCTLEFENRRESYFWLLDVLDLYKPVVWEYSRLNISKNVLSKRKLLKLVFGGYVRGWDDPRMYTINGLRRRGYTAEILRNFCHDIGVTRKDNVISPSKLESCARKVLESSASRAMCVTNPLKIVITNYPNNKTENIECPDFPQNRELGSHNVEFSRVIYIDKSDFRNDLDGKALKKYYGLAPGKTVRLKYAYNIKCEKVVTDNNGNIKELECSYDESSRHDPKTVKKGHLTWVSASDGVACEIRLYDYLFSVDAPSGDDWLKQLNPDSEIICNGFVNKHVINHKDDRFQFERVGYFVKDNKDYTPQKPVFNSIVSLKQKDFL